MWKKDIGYCAPECRFWEVSQQEETDSAVMDTIAGLCRKDKWITLLITQKRPQWMNDRHFKHALKGLGCSRPRRIVTNLLSCALEASLLTYLLTYVEQCKNVQIPRMDPSPFVSDGQLLTTYLNSVSVRSMIT